MEREEQRLDAAYCVYFNEDTQQAAWFRSTSSKMKMEPQASLMSAGSSKDARWVGAAWGFFFYPWCMALRALGGSQRSD
eukprot:gene28537-34447_t